MLDQPAQALQQAFQADNFNVWPHLIAMLIAYVLALPIGWHREKTERSAGLRTFPLVAMAGCAFIQATESITTGSPEALARITEGVITGMGFIGGGAILKVRDSVRGTATAASLWATGAIGIAAGLGSYDVGLIISLMTFVTLLAFSPKGEADKEAASTKEGSAAETE